FTVALALFSAFPMFASFQGALEKVLLQALVPEAIAKPVLRALTQFATKARGIGGVGLVLFGATALAMMLTIDRTLNAIWRVRRPRPLGQRLLVYWGALTLGPLVVGISLTLASYAFTASRGMVEALPGGLSFMLDLLEFGLLAAAMAALFHHVPNTWVRWRHAIAGGLFVAVAIELAKAGLAWYLKSVPSLSAIYGTFATLPILMLWVYLAWVIVLLGAVIAAYAPSLSMRVVRQAETPGLRFALALRSLQQIRDRQGASLGDLAAAMRLDPLQLEPVLDQLVALDWIGRLDEEGAARHVLLTDPDATPVMPLVDALLLAPGQATAAFRERAGLARMTLGQLLG
ncbi:MAG: YihY family inner membrane protein, partial [Rhodoferax sp.]|nr:YihY family inner membrane protein [Rhodoferax sp.]